MIEPEEDGREEEVLPFPEVYIKVEPQEAQIEAQDCLEEDLEEGDVLDMNHFEGIEMAVDYGGLDDDEQDHREDESHYEDMGMGDGGLEDDDDRDHKDNEVSSGAALSELMQDELRCGLCQKEYASPASLKAHLSKKHKMAVGPCFTCHLCGAIGQTRATLKRHLLRTHGQSSLISHQLLRKCQHCGEGYLTQDALNTHKAEAHADLLSQYQQCPHCPSLLTSRQSLLRHIGRRHPDADTSCLDQEQCQECQLFFPSRTALRLHVKNQHPETLIHRCETCSTTFKYSYLLRRHIKNIHEKKEQQKGQQVRPKRYKCLKCPREYRSKSHLERHTLSHLTPKKPRMYKCSVCGTKFNTRGHRSRHMRLAHWDKSRLKCSECKKSFESMEQLNEHRQTHRMSCAVCDKTFLRRDSLREHLLIHSGPKLPCPYCPKKFTQSSNLKRHIRIHTGEKPYKCSFCTKRFGDKSACNSHMRVHTGAERCSCPVCGASFSKRQKLNYHMRKHTGEGLLLCPLCSRSATNSYSLKKHLETHQTVLARLLQGSGVLTRFEDCQRLAILTLHNLAWATARGKTPAQTSSQHLPETPSPGAGDKVEGCKEEVEQTPSGDHEDNEGGGEDSEDIRTPIEHIEVDVKIEVPDEMDEEVHSPASDKEINSNLRQFRKVSKLDITSDPLEVSDTHEAEDQKDDVKTEVLSYIMSLRIAQFNEAVRCALEKCKLEAAKKEERDRIALLENYPGQSSEMKSEENEVADEVEDVYSFEASEDTESGLSNMPSSNTKELNLQIMETAMQKVESEGVQVGSSTLTEENLLVLARLWRLIIGQTDEQQPCKKESPLSKCWVQEQDTQDSEETDKDAGNSIPDLRIKTEPEPDLHDTNTSKTHDSDEGAMDSEPSECDDENSS